MKKLLFTISIMLLFVSCSDKSLTLDKRYPKVYEEKPLTIAIFPPINQTNHVEAKDYFYTTLYKPLCERGYYVFSPMLTMELYQSESAYDAEQFIHADLSKFREVLGADAAMFTIIKSWKRNNVGGKIRVNIEYILRSTKTGETLYQREGNITLDTSVGGSGGGLIGLAVKVVATAVNTATTDKVVAGRKCSAYILRDLPSGKYSPLFEKDQKMKSAPAIERATVK